MTDVVSILGARVLSIDSDKCILDDANGDTATLKFVTPSGGDRSYNFAKIFRAIENFGVPTYFRKQLSMNEHMISITRALPLICTIRTAANAEFAKQFGVQAGHRLKSPIIEWQFEASALSNPYVTTDHISAFDIVEQSELRCMQDIAQKILHSLNGFFVSKNYSLGAIKLRFGLDNWGRVLLVGEVSAPEVELWSLEDFSMLDHSHSTLRSLLAS